VVGQIKADLTLLQSAWDARDWQETGQQTGKLTTDWAQAAGGVKAIAQLGVKAASAGGRLLLEAAEDLGFTKTLSIDDLYKVARPDVDFVVVEYKFGTAKLGKTLDGVQMSDGWLLGTNTGKNRLLDAVGREEALLIDRALKTGRVEKWLVHTDPFGAVTVGLLDKNAKLIAKPVSGVIGVKP
jgi:hypothetical protein